MSELKTNLITPYAGTTVTMGESGDTIALAAGATSTGFGNGNVAFPATQVPSADANTLDDYEEGYFTMAMTSAGGSLTINSSNDQGSYTKIGRLVVARGYCIASSVSSPTGDFNITGLPFAQAALTEEADNGTGSVRLSGCTSNLTTYVYGQVASGSTSLLIREGGLTGGGNDVAAHINTGTSVAFCVSYFTD